jgi:large subunit ribosomal protein L22
MQATARAKFIRISPTKIRRVINQIRGKALEEALGILDFTQSPIAGDVKKVLAAAAANAENNFAMRKEELWVQTCFVDGGPVLKRMQPATMGRGSVIRKRTSHITIVLADREDK